MSQRYINLLLADDDPDDRMFFKEVLTELPYRFDVATVNNGVDLMRHLASETILPDALFLDLNMPGKNGFECLTEIKSNKKLSTIPVIIYSTSFDSDVVNHLFENGARYYVRKPGDFSKLRDVIHETIDGLADVDYSKPSINKFVIQAR